MGSKFPKNTKKYATIPMQKYNLLIKHKKLLIKDNSNKRLDMDFLIKSSNSSNEYIIKIKYDNIFDTSKLFLLSPKLDVRPNETIPHTYGMKKVNGKEYLQICPFYPSEDWNNKMIIADTVLLWSIEWFYFYEIWFVSGVWCGRRKTSRKWKK